MEIKDMRKKNKVPFETLNNGDVFMWNETVLMRTRNCMCKNTLCNAIVIESGDFCIFENNDLVEKLNAEVVIH